MRVIVYLGRLVRCVFLAIDESADNTILYGILKSETDAF